MPKIRKSRKLPIQPSLRGGRSSRRSNPRVVEEIASQRTLAMTGQFDYLNQNRGLLKIHLVLEPQPEGGYTVTCPMLPELITEGDNIRDAIENADDALEAIIESYSILERPLPPNLLSP